MISRWRLSALLLCFVLFPTACTGGGGETTDQPTSGATGEAGVTEEATDAAGEVTEGAASPEGTEAPVTRADADLVIWADDTRAPVLEEFGDRFADEHGVSVAVQELAFDQIGDQLQVAGPAGEGPDIIVTAHDALGEMVANGVVAPFDLPNAQDYATVAVQAVTYENQVYGLPYAIENIALLRNTDLVPEAPETWAELEETALRLQESGDVELGLALQADPPDPYHNYPMFSALGGYVFGQAPDGTYDPEDLGVDSRGGLTAAAHFRRWVREGLINPNTTYDVMIETFGSGQAAFAITGPWAVAQPDSGFHATGVPYEVTPIPPVEGGTPRPFVGVQAFFVSAFSENVLLAQTFLADFMSTEKAQLGLFEAGARPPALLSAFEQAQDDPDVKGFGESGQNGVPLPAIPEMSAVWSAWTDAYGLIYQGQGKPRQNFRNAADQIRKLVEEG